MNLETKTYSDGTVATGPAPLPTESPAEHLCPRCGTEEWDRVDAERGRERDVPFNRCCHCEHEWEAS